MLEREEQLGLESKEKEGVVSLLVETTLFVVAVVSSFFLLPLLRTFQFPFWLGEYEANFCLRRDDEEG